MPIPNSGALALSTIQTEFGGSNPISLSEYYAGGVNVPSGTSGVNGSVPSSGTISFSKFYGTSDLRVTISNQDVSDLVIDPADAFAQYSLAANGVASTATSGGSGPVGGGEWRVSGASADYQVRATLQSGSITSGTTGSWLSLSTGREWSISQTSFGTGSATLLIEIRDAVTLAVLDSATVTLTAEVQI